MYVLEDIKYINLIDISTENIEIREVENGELVVPVNDALLCHTGFFLGH